MVSVSQGLNYRIEVDGVSHRVDRDDGGLVHAPAPAVVVSIAVKPGDTVSIGDRLAVLEAMKMEMQVVAPFSGRVRRVLIIPNVQARDWKDDLDEDSRPHGAWRLNFLLLLIRLSSPFL